MPNTVSKGRVNNIKGVILYNRVKAMQPLTVRHMSSFIDQDRANFLEWFRGFTDAEGCFTIGAVGNSHYFQFSFTIGLHIDDIEVLEYIQKTLGMGNIHISGGMAVWGVRRQEDIVRIIDIFNLVPLNTVKHLDFLDFYKAFDIYMANKKKFRN